MRTAENGDALVTTGYDAADRPTSFATTLTGSSQADTVSYSYDAAGRRSTMAYGGVTDSYSYDSVGRLTALASSQAGTFRYAYDEAGRRSELQRPNGVTTSYAYNTTDQVTSIIHAKAGATLDETRYTYDAFGRRTVVRQYDGDHTYGYDAAGRVTSADNPAGQADETFTYDELGNRTSAGEQYDAANRLQSRTGYTYLSDREGRITDRIAGNGDATRFSWDAQDRLRAITLPDGSVTRLRYDPLGRRVATSRDGQTRVQTYGLDPNAVAESSGSASTRFTFGLGYDTPLAMSTAATASYFQQDALGSVTSLTGAAGTVTGRYSYDTYGQITSHTGADSPYTYTGREWDAPSGLYHYRARWYEPATGRFISEDPVPAANLYAYAAGHPTALVDPSGQTASMAEQEQVSFVSGVLSGAKWGGGIGAAVSLKRGIQCGLEAGKLLESVVVGAGKGALVGATGAAAFGAFWRGLNTFAELTPLAAKAIAAVPAAYASLLVGLAYDAATDSPHLWDDPTLWDLGTALANVAGRASAPAGRAGTAEESDGKKGAQGCDA